MKLFVRSMRHILRSPVRLILVVVILGASLMFVAAMITLNTNAQNELATVHKQVGTAININYAENQASGFVQSTPQPGRPTGGSGGTTTTITPGSNTPIPNSVVAKVEKVPGVASVQESLVRPYTGSSLTGGTITGANGQQLNAPLLVNGIPTDSTNFTLQGGATPTLVAGRSFDSSDATADVAMMSQSVATANHLYVGSNFRLEGVVFTVIGLYTTPNQFSNSSMVIPLATMQKVFDIKGVDSLTAYAATYEQVQSVANKIQSLLGKAYDVVTQADQYSNVFSALAVAKNSIHLALVVSFLVAAAVIVFAVLMLVRERTAEIAIQKTIGASDWQVLRQFWIEIVTLCVVAAGLAAVLLLTLGPAISQWFDINASALASTGPSSSGPVIISGPGTGGGIASSTNGSNSLGNVHLAAATLNVETLLIILGVGLGLALLTSLIPTWIVSHIKPAEVLRRAG